MSQVYKDLGAKYYIYAGTKKGFTSNIIDPTTGRNADMSNQLLYSTGIVNITKADGTLITTANITFTNRVVNTSYVTWIVGPFTNDQAGNWQGFLKILNANGDTIDQQTFNFTILESY